MKVVHLINKLKIDYDPRTRGPYDTKHEGLFRTDVRDIYVSCCWDFNSEEAMQLVGGRIYLHHTKKEKSFMGEWSQRLQTAICALQTNTSILKNRKSHLDLIEFISSFNLLLQIATFGGTLQVNRIQWHGLRVS